MENGGTAIGIRCKDGVVLAVEKIISSKLLKPGANKRISTVDRHVGVVRSGRFTTDGYLQSLTKSFIGFIGLDPRRSTFRIQSTQRSFVMAINIQVSCTGCCSCKQARKLRPGSYDVF